MQDGLCNCNVTDEGASALSVHQHLQRHRLWRGSSTDHWHRRTSRLPNSVDDDYLYISLAQQREAIYQGGPA